MPHEVTLERVAPRPMAAVRRRVRAGEVGAAWKPALDQVWAYLRAHDGLRTDGHNIFLYRHAAGRDEPMIVDFGVEISGGFPGEGEVIGTETPAGEVATTLHVGPIERLGAAHEAIHAWRAVHGRDLAGVSWEIYGDWTDDPATNEVRVVYLLAEATTTAG
jgi:effector-binding domain-containing protein